MMTANPRISLLLASLVTVSVEAADVVAAPSVALPEAETTAVNPPPPPQSPEAKPAAEAGPEQNTASAADTPITTATQTEVVEDPTVASWRLLPNIFLFDYSSGVGEDKTHFLERYDYREGLAGGSRSGAYPDLDLSLTYGNLSRDLVTLERRGFGEHNHRGEGRYSSDKIGVSGAYSHHRTATGGIDYLFNLNEVSDYTQIAIDPADTFVDAASQTDFHVDRTTYAAGLTMKPALLGGWGKISVDYQGYRRDGSKFAPYHLGDSGGSGGSGGSDAWGGTNLGIDERMNRFSINLDAVPRNWFNVNYKVVLEKFSNEAPDLVFEDLGLSAPSGGMQALDPLFYIPDTTLLSQSIQISKNFQDRFLIAVGYNHATLSDDSSPAAFESSTGPEIWAGKIVNDSAFLNANWLISPSLSAEGFVKYHQRDNDSTFPVSNLIDPDVTTLLLAPYIQGIDSLDYGLAANWRPEFMSSTLTLGWHRLDRERELVYGSIGPAQTLYREDTLSDEVYLKWIARPATGWTVRLTPSYTWADSTGIVSEPEETFKFKALASYAAPAGWMVNGFYDYRHKLNGNNTFSDGGSGSGTPLTYTQDIDSTLHSAGVSLNVIPRDNINAFINLFWVQDDLSSYLFTTRATRWTPSVEFTLVDEPEYKINTYSIGFGADWQASDDLSISASYTYSRSNGKVASGTVLTALEEATGSVDSRIDNHLHSLAIGAEYVLNPKATLRANYVFDYYDDNAYGLLTGRVHTLVLGVMLGF